MALALSNNPGAATLTGMTTENASGGVATFTGLSLTQSGNGYTLGASSARTAPATSALPRRPGSAGAVPGGARTALTFSQGSGGTPTASGPGGTSGSLVGSVNSPGAGPLACAGYVSMDPNTYEFFSTDENLNKVVTITITDPIGAPPYDPRDTDGFKKPGGDGDNDYDVLWNSVICFPGALRVHGPRRGAGDVEHAAGRPDRVHRAAARLQLVVHRSVPRP